MTTGEDDPVLKGDSFPILPTCLKEGQEMTAETELTEGMRGGANSKTIRNAERYLELNTILISILGSI